MPPKSKPCNFPCRSKKAYDDDIEVIYEDFEHGGEKFVRAVYMDQRHVARNRETAALRLGLMIGRVQEVRARHAVLDTSTYSGGTKKAKKPKRKTCDTN